MEAVEQLLDDQASKLEVGLADGKADMGARVLALQEETAEHLSGFREFLDSELNSIQDDAEKTREELTEAIATNGCACVMCCEIAREHLSVCRSFCPWVALSV